MLQCLLSKKRGVCERTGGACLSDLLGGDRAADQAGDLSLMAYDPAVCSPEGPLQTLEMPSHVGSVSVMVRAMCHLSRP